MTTKEDAPLFNRSYLKLMPVLVGAVILWLSLSNQSDKAPKIETLTPNHTYLVVQKQTTVPALHLTYAVAPGLSYQQAEYRHAIQHAFNQALGNYPAISANWFDDRVTLHIPVSRIRSGSLPKLIDAFITDVFDLYPNALKRAAAEHYLDQNEQQAQALLNLTQQIAGYRSTVSVQQVFSQPPLALLELTGRDKKLTQDITQQIAALSSRHASLDTQDASSLSTPSSIHLTHRGTGYLYMLGQAARANTMDDTDLVASHLLGQQLATLTSNSDTQFRLVQKPLRPIGYRALLLQKDSPFKAGLEDRLKATIEQTLTNEQLDTTRTLLVQQYRDQLADSQSRIALINQGLFYNRPTVSADQFRDTLDDITLAQVITRINEWLDPNRSLTLLIEPL